MKPYSDYPARLARQVLCDVIAVIVIVQWVRLGRWVHEQIIGQQQWGLRMEEAGAGFRGTMTDVGQTLGDVPFIGDAIQAPFTVASNAGAELEAAGQAQQDAFADLALIAGLSVSVLPILAVLVLWLVPRLIFARRAHHVAVLARSGAGTDLFALRALVTLSPGALLKVHPDPAGAWRTQDPEVIADLARLGMASAGVKPPASVPERSDLP